MIFLVLNGLFLLGCNSGAPEQGNHASKSEESIALYVDGIDVTMEELEEEYKYFLGEMGLEKPDSPDHHEQIVELCYNSLIENIVLFDVYMEKKLEIPVEESTIRGIISSRETFPEGFDLLEERVQMWQNRVQRRLAVIAAAAAKSQELSRSIVIEPDEIHQFYAENQHLFTIPLSLDTRVIRVFDPDLATDIHAKVKGGWSFEKLAERYSKERGKAAKGQIFQLNLQEIDPDFITVLEKTMESHVSPVLTSYQGYYIYKVEKRYPEHILEFDAVKKDIEEKLHAQKRSELFREWMKKKKSELNIRIGTPLPFEADEQEN